MNQNTKLPYRPCVGIALFNSANKVFVGERIDTPGAWQMPQGGIDSGEEIAHAAKRELYEETGIKDAQILRIAPQTICYDLPDHLRAKLWNGKYRGQEQHWVAMRFTGDDRDIALDQHEEPAEFSQWQWITPQESVNLIIPLKQDVYTKVFEIFKEFY